MKIVLKDFHLNNFLLSTDIVKKLNISWLIAHYAKQYVPGEEEFVTNYIYLENFEHNKYVH